MASIRARLGVILFLTFFVAAPSPAALPAEIVVVTEEYPPYNYRLYGHLTGLSTEMVEAVFKELGIKANFKILPWGRAYREARDGTNVLIYSIGRNAEREKDFKWVGMLSDTRNYFFSRRGSTISLQTIEEAKKYRIGTVAKDAREDGLIALGFQKGVNLEPEQNSEINYQKLKSGRIDLWPMNEDVMAYTVRLAGDDPHETVQKVLSIDSLFERPANFMAFGQKTPDETVLAFRAALEKLKTNGTLEAIQKRWRDRF